MPVGGYGQSVAPYGRQLRRFLVGSYAPPGSHIRRVFRGADEPLEESLGLFDSQIDVQIDGQIDGQRRGRNVSTVIWHVGLWAGQEVVEASPRGLLASGQDS